MGAPYPHLSPATDDGYSEWVRPCAIGYKMGCCDCGLVHTMDFRIKEGQVEFRVARANRSTANIRRYSEPTFNLTFVRFALRSLVALYAEQPARVRRRFIATITKRLFP